MITLFKSYEKIIPKFSLFQKILHGPMPIHLRVNSLKADPVSLLRNLNEKGLHFDKKVISDITFIEVEDLQSPGNLSEYFMGHVHPQSFTSCLASIVLNPGKGSFVLDMCASPGGKTTLMAQLMDNTGLIVANDLFPGRHVSLGNTIDRLGAMNTIITGYQAQQFPLKEPFDFVLADVPCSGEGRFRNINSASKYRKSDSTASLPQLQKKIALRGFDALKKGGEMLYSTCTYNPEENEGVVDFVLKNRDAHVLTIDIGVDYDPGIGEWKNTTYDSRIEKSARFYPHRINSVGFFMARIGKP